MRQVVVIGPTKAIAQSIFTTLQVPPQVETLLVKECGKQLKTAFDELSLENVGIIAGTGTGKTLAILEASKTWLGLDPKDWSLDIVHGQSEEIPNYTRDCHVIVTTPEVALAWIDQGFLGYDTLLVLDELHLTSEHLELVEGLSKSQGSPLLWMSATVDGQAFHRLLGGKLIIYEGFDSTRKATMVCTSDEPLEILEEILPEAIKKQQGILVFLSTREGTEAGAQWVRDKYPSQKLTAEFYHGGENPVKLRKLLLEAKSCYVYFMTTAGSSSLNVQGLSRVIIEDTIYKEVITPSGKSMLVRREVDNSTLIQMIGRVHGRAIDGKVWVSTWRKIVFEQLKPSPVEFVLGGNLERAVFTAAKLHIDLTALELPGELNVENYRKELKRLIGQGIVTLQHGLPYLTGYGQLIDRIGLGSRWSEVVARAMREPTYHSLVDAVLVIGCVEELAALFRENARYFAVKDSDHLTVYNVMVEALTHCRIQPTKRTGRLGYVPASDFKQWYRERGINGQAIRGALDLMRSVYFRLKRKQPKLQALSADQQELFVKLLAETQSMEAFVTKEDESAPATKSVLSYMNLAVGSARLVDIGNAPILYFEGTNIPSDLAIANAVTKLQDLVKLDAEQVVMAVGPEFCGIQVGEVTQITITPDEVDARFIDRFYQLLAERLCSRQTGNAELEKVLSQNLKQLERSAVINTLLGYELVKGVDLAAFYKDTICKHDIRRLSRVEPTVFALPKLDEALITSRLKEVDRPETIKIAEVILPITYASEAAYVTLPDDFMQANLWRKLSGTITLLGKLKVEVTVTLPGNKTHRNANLDELREAIRQHLNGRQYNYSTKPIITPEMTEAVTNPPPVLAVVYGTDALNDEPLVMYGTWAFDLWFKNWSCPFKGEWFTTLEEAEAARSEVQSRINTIQEGYAQDRKRDQRQAYANELYEEVKRLYSKRHGQRLRAYVHRMPVRIEAWIAEVEPIVQLVRLLREVEELQCYAHALLSSEYCENLYAQDYDDLEVIADDPEIPEDASSLVAWIATAKEVIDDAEFTLLEDEQKKCTTQEQLRTIRDAALSD